MDALLIGQLQAELPIRVIPYRMAGLDTGMVIINMIHGLCHVGASTMAPTAPDQQITRMIDETNRMARQFVERKWPVLGLVDASAERAQTGREPLVPELAWLEDEPDVTILCKDCVNGFVGGIEAVHHGTHGTSRNRVVDWVNAHRLQSVLVTGFRTDVCVMEFVLTMLSARDHGLMPTLRDIVVLESATSTYHLSREAVGDLGLPPTAAHPKLPAHHMGLYFMASRGALLAGELTDL